MEKQSIFFFTGDSIVGSESGQSRGDRDVSIKQSVKHELFCV